MADYRSIKQTLNITKREKMPKIKILSNNRTQQVNVVKKCQNWGATARDGDTGPVAGKTAVVINTKLGAGASILVSNVDFVPQKNPYSQTLSYKDFMNLTTCPWDASVPQSDATDDWDEPIAQPKTRTVEVPVPVIVPVPVEVGVCAQDTLQVTACDILIQEPIAWETLGLPALQDMGVEVTMHEGVAYVLDLKSNTAKPMTAKKAAKQAKKALLNGDTDSPYARYARQFDLVDNAIMSKIVDDSDD